MNKIAIVSDVHIGNSPSTRKDDYFKTCLNKLEYILSNNSTVVFLGDLFDAPVINNDKLYEVYVLFQKYRDVKKYSIIGNHDIFNMNPNTLHRTSLGLLELVGAIKLIRDNETVNIDGLNFTAMPLNFGDIVGSTERGVVLGHHFYGLNCYESLSKEDLLRLYPNGLAYFFGHDHCQYNTDIISGNIPAVRMGSLTRNAMVEYNRYRQVQYALVHTEDNTIQGIEFIAVPMAPAEEVFVESAWNKTKQKRKEFITRLEEVIELCSSRIDSAKDYSVLEVLKELDTPKPCVDYILRVCKVLGVTLN